MVGVEAHGGSRRRLPSWMVGLGDAGTRLDRKSNETSKSVAISETTTRSRRKSTHQQEEDINISEKKKKRKVHESAPRKKNKLRQIQIQTSVDEIEDDHREEELTLTVEDLLSIAKEYVQVDGKRAELRSSNTDFESEKQLQESTSFENDLNGGIRNHKVATDSATSLISESEQSLVSVTRTGDPAQDMLDLFLGPLLKKPIEEQNRTKFSTNDNDIEFMKLSQTQKKNDAGQEHFSTPVKTKSSLKDKVARLLD